MKLRVLIVDDSPFVRELLRVGLEPIADVEVVGEAGDGMAARRLVAELQPDVVTMDVVMPLVGGLDAIRAIMRERPTPIVVVADTGEDAGRMAVAAIAAGAVEVFAKPRRGFGQGEAERLARVLRAAAAVRVSPAPAPAARRPIADGAAAGRLAGVRFIAITASTGGPPALAALLGELPAGFPVPIALVQHTAAGFTAPFVAWLDSIVKLKVVVAAPGGVALPGQVTVAPDLHHLEVAAGNAVRLTTAPPIGGHRPAGDVLLASVARLHGNQAMGIVLSGMGSDGAAGLAAIHRAGGLAAIERPEGAVLDAMPRAALRACGEALIGSPADIGAALRGARGRP
jgi:two-component system, chemotaxis family, protein-glutamate methylesterase/glutaminase